MSYKSIVGSKKREDKISIALFGGVYSQIVSHLLKDGKSPEEVNEILKKFGKNMGERLVIMSGFVDYFKSGINKLEDVAKSVALIYKMHTNQELSDIKISGSGDLIEASDTHCAFCRDVKLGEMPDLHYCETFSGIIEYLLDIYGWNITVHEKECKATGADKCTWVIRIKGKK